MHWILAPEPSAGTVCPVPLVEDLLLSSEYTSFPPLARTAWLRASLHVAESAIQRVVGMTMGQRNNQIWAMVRKLRITASNFGIVLRALSTGRFVFGPCMLGHVEQAGRQSLRHQFPFKIVSNCKAIMNKVKLVIVDNVLNQ